MEWTGLRPVHSTGTVGAVLPHRLLASLIVAAILLALSGIVLSVIG